VTRAAQHLVEALANAGVQRVACSAAASSASSNERKVKVKRTTELSGFARSAR
jgi:hypothetical protein